MGLNIGNAITDLPADVDNSAIWLYNQAASAGNAVLYPISNFVPACSNGPAFPQMSYYNEWNWSQSRATPETGLDHQISVANKI